MYHKTRMTREIAVCQWEMLLQIISHSNDLQALKNQSIRLLTEHRVDAEG